MMKIDMRIWRDVSDEPTPKLVRNLSLASVGFIPFGALAGACFAVASHGGTTDIAPWQWSLSGIVVSLFLGLMAFGCFRLGKTINSRVDDQREESSQHIGGPYFK